MGSVKTVYDEGRPKEALQQKKKKASGESLGGRWAQVHVLGSQKVRERLLTRRRTGGIHWISEKEVNSRGGFAKAAEEGEIFFPKKGGSAKVKKGGVSGPLREFGTVQFWESQGARSVLPRALLETAVKCLQI